MTQFAILSQFKKTRRKSNKIPIYSPIDDDYFWELLRTDYSSAWKYADRMRRSIAP
jgi:hypothetical protein